MNIIEPPCVDGNFLFCELLRVQEEVILRHVPHVWLGVDEGVPHVLLGDQRGHGGHVCHGGLCVEGSVLGPGLGWRRGTQHPKVGVGLGQPGPCRVLLETRQPLDSVVPSHLSDYLESVFPTNSPVLVRIRVTVPPCLLCVAAPLPCLSTMITRSPIPDSINNENRILCVSFNQDQQCFALGTENGFRVYNSDPPDLKVKREFRSPTSSSTSPTTKGGIGIITMLYRTNYLALVGGGRNPQYPENKLIIWDDLKKQDSLNLEFFSPILNVLLSRTKIIIILKNKIFIYTFSIPPSLIISYETFQNKYGIVALSYGLNSSISPSSLTSNLTTSSNPPTSTKIKSSHILAFPSISEGQIQLVDISPEGQERNLISIIRAHKSTIRCLALNRSGTMIASASETGTIIRIHSTSSTSLLYEFRRGLDRADIYSMSFSPLGTRLAVLSDKKTLHIYNIDLTIDSNDSNDNEMGMGSSHNKHHLLNNVPLLPRYFSSTWSFCSIRVDSPSATGNSGGNSSIIDNDFGTLGWTSEDSVTIVWKNQQKWEKYIIIEDDENDQIKKFNKNSSKNKNDNNGNTSNDEIKWKLVRDGWRSLNDN